MLSHRLSAMIKGQRFLISTARHLSKSSFLNKALVREVNPYPKIKISSNLHLNVKPYDLLECPNGNLLRISLTPKETNEPTPANITELLESFDADVEVSNENISIDTKNGFGKGVNVDELANDVVCLIEVPVKADLNVSGKGDVVIQNMYSDEVTVTSDDGNIVTKNVHSVKVNLTAHNGEIRCEGSTLAHEMEVRSYGEKNIHLNRVMGDSLTAITENGTISTNSCYSENSKFITQKGSLQLKNVHKKSELNLLEGGDLDVTGFHGILNATTNGGTLNFQLTEIFGESFIKANNPSKFNINISEFVEQHTCLSINANEITIEPALDHFEKHDSSTGQELKNGDRDLIEDSLLIETNGKLKLGKLSWMDTVKLKLSAQKQNNDKESLVLND